MNEAIASDERNARRGLAIYFAALILGSAFFEWRILQTGESIAKTPSLVLGLMYMPALASIIARLANRDRFTDVSFRCRGSEGARTTLLAWIYPMLVGFLAYGIAWATGLAQFQRPLTEQSHLYTSSAPQNFLTSFVFMATLGTVLSCLSAFGEELGWRGYMLTRLMVAGIPRPVFVSGLVWAIWHVPLILSGQYAVGTSPWLSAVLFVIGVIADAYLAAYVRLRSGSVWPAMMYHGAWNAIIQGTFDRATVGTPQVVGESGWLTVTIAVIVVLFLTQGTWKLQRTPTEPLNLLQREPATTLTV